MYQIRINTMTEIFLQYSHTKLIFIIKETLIRHIGTGLTKAVKVSEGLFHHEVNAQVQTLRRLLLEKLELLYRKENK